MKTDPQLHHVCKKIVPGSTMKVTEIFALLGCEVTYQEPSESWFMVGQQGLPFEIQLIEKAVTPLSDQFKINSHVAFVSENPTELISKIEFWVEKNDLPFKSVLMHVLRRSVETAGLSSHSFLLAPVTCHG